MVPGPRRHGNEAAEEEATPNEPKRVEATGRRCGTASIVLVDVKGCNAGAGHGRQRHGEEAAEAEPDAPALGTTHRPDQDGQSGRRQLNTLDWR
ncbi:hypothetical protein E2562_020785 [Oryza meyeriana var. granulata]|uniref:Uncharacterized protein n=1 Tax=Oryza meyeriana var. granulata TaxID=110450 RepID=A0A6G1CIZ7_9ORYZ|nr:hypothetical protein E2562_020785 [Oryza meyeriana var. granulata]